MKIPPSNDEMNASFAVSEEMLTGQIESYVKSYPKISPKAMENTIGPIRANKLMQQTMECPDSNCRYGLHKSTLDFVIQHLNDEHRWTREKIADWLDTLPEQPIYYPDVRTDDEKIEEGLKQSKVEIKSSWKTKAVADVVKTYLEILDEPVKETKSTKSLGSCGCKKIVNKLIYQCGKCGQDGHLCDDCPYWGDCKPKPGGYKITTISGEAVTYNTNDIW